MGKKLKNVICEPDIIEGIKRQIFELITLKQTTCNNLPNLEIPNVLPDVPNLNPSQSVVDFLNDLLALITGINYDGMRMQLINWLVEQLEPLSKDLALNLKLSLKSCYACKIDPKIPDWLLQTQSDGTTGIGYNVELNKIDLVCLFAANPNTESGKLFYEGTCDPNGICNDMNAFLWEVIQANGQPLIWKDSINNMNIAEFRYYENGVSLNSNNAFTDSDGNVEYQNIEHRSRVINVRIMDSYRDKTLITFINDYFNSQNPLFDVDKVIPNVVDIIYGSLTNKIDLSDECVNKVVSFESAMRENIEKGIDNIDDSLDDEVDDDISDLVKQKKLGVKQFKKCCGKQTSSISFETLNSINNNIKSSNNLSEKVKSYTDAIDDLIDESTEGVKNLDKNNASAEFLANFITSLNISLTKLVLTPKNLLMMNMLYFLVNGEPIKETKVKKILNEFKCVIKDIISEIIRKLIYDYLLPLVLKALKNLITCYITKKLKERNINDIKSVNSLLPPAVSNSLEKANELFGKAQGAADKVGGFANSINLNSLSNVNINLQSGSKGRFCD
tara:strand:- start:4950 stop:6626 length:1677 start_codon:yes stop_codon:yes gene_type:complete